MIVLIESKEYGFSVSQAVPQNLAYMMGNPHADHPTFGVITNGEKYILLKLSRREINQYVLSDLFSISNSHNNWLNEGMRVLKRLVGLSCLYRDEWYDRAQGTGALVLAMQLK